MRNKKYTISEHAAKRMAQRNLDGGDLAVVLKLGRRVHCAGAKFFFLGKHDLPHGGEKDLARLIGSVVVVIKERFIATVYRNRKAISKIKHKPKHCAHYKREGKQAYSPCREGHMPAK